jgi:hypothetical protein
MTQWPRRDANNRERLLTILYRLTFSQSTTRWSFRDRALGKTSTLQLIAACEHRLRATSRPNSVKLAVTTVSGESFFVANRWSTNWFLSQAAMAHRSSAERPSSP